jgi:hypothetical protein
LTSQRGYHKTEFGVKFSRREKKTINAQILQLLVIIAIALVLFSLEFIPVDVVALGVVLALILTGLLPVEEAFAGFGSDTFMLILGLLSR